MLIAQVGFATISITAILAVSDLVAILLVNMVFAIIVAYSNYAAMKRVTGGIKRFDKYFCGHYGLYIL